ncbi:tetratricopeptide repeat protein [Sphingomonas naphthae]|uniref:Tetratricopeptide repeat protein n=1 Tax=Sphingomonas naphthae TaxID=1813468 RepID=A0ABY7TLC9_9SPHN|nr:tetratricopeptide repeat protein [Sphingomonas naphthae]WCT73049.1 tetratricopeptide repeat protein [Sphingomonas naphthae]
MTTIADLNAMDAAGLREALSGPPERTAAIVKAAAEQGSIEAMLLFGQMLLDGRGVARAPGEAVRWFDRAARGGHAMAMNMVGRCCEKGWGVKADPALAARWYRAAADRGLDWGLYNLATLLSLGEGVTRDRPAALALFEKAAALGHAKSINMVGSFHEDGWVVEADMAAAAAHYARAAEGGDFRGQFNHARMRIAAGDIAGATRWIMAIPATATPAFLARVRLWLGERAEPDLRRLADVL